jgi:hypothetical protein
LRRFVVVAVAMYSPSRPPFDTRRSRRVTRTRHSFEAEDPKPSRIGGYSTSVKMPPIIVYTAQTTSVSPGLGE